MTTSSFVIIYRLIAEMSDIEYDDISAIAFIIDKIYTPFHSSKILFFGAVPA